MINIAMYKAQLTHVTFKPNSFLLINAANLQDKLEPVAKSLWGTLSQNAWCNVDVKILIICLEIIGVCP